MAENLRGLAELGLIGLGCRASTAARACRSSSTRRCSRCWPAPTRRRWSSTRFYSSPAAMILRFGSDAQKQRWVPRLARGEIIGWVAMTEPEAGSDVGNISTTATPPARRYLAHQRSQAVHLERQRRGRRAAGARGRRLDGSATAWRCFVVPRVAIGGRARKRARSNAPKKRCASTARRPARCRSRTATPRSWAAPGDGWRQITTFMNEARIAVGIQACGVAQARSSPRRTTPRSGCR